MRVKFQDWGPGFDRFAGRIRDMIHEMRVARSYCSRACPSWTPRINMYETDAHIIVCMELAGLDPDDIELRLTDGVLRVEGVRARPVLPEEFAESTELLDISVHTMEIDSGKFCREITLPADAVGEQSFASYRQGLLWIVLGKSPRPGRES